MTKRSRAIALLGAGTVLVAGGTATASAAGSSHPIKYGKTTVSLEAATMKAVHGAGLKLQPVGAAGLDNGVLRLPVRGGTVDLPNYVLKQAGGFDFTNGSKTVSVTSIVLRTKTYEGTADVSGHGNVVALGLGQANEGNGGPGWAQFGGYSVSLAPAAVKALDHAFGTTVFANHNTLGTGSTTVHYGS